MHGDPSSQSMLFVHPDVASHGVTPTPPQHTAPSAGAAALALPPNGRAQASSASASGQAFETTEDDFDSSDSVCSSTVSHSSTGEATPRTGT